jgi:UDPglucose 6-dehydrogenase
MGVPAPLVAVFGLGHLGSVTAACLASAGIRVIGTDIDAAAVARLAAGKPPVFEPGLEDLTSRALAAGTLHFTADRRAAVAAADVIWVTFDTPVNDEDVADVDLVTRSVLELLPSAAAASLVLISSQLPVGTTGRLEREFRAGGGPERTAFACVPENLRLGSAVEVFLHPDRLIVGLRDPRSRPAVEDLLRPLALPIEWMSAESAEMTKHAINAFLATSIAFMNEVSAICERAGADAKEVERGLKTDARIGPRAYLAPGPAIAGGTLLRDIGYLGRLATAGPDGPSLFSSVHESNRRHAAWPARKLAEHFGSVRGHRVAVLGLAYKAGTSSVRRSAALELCSWLSAEGASVRVHDPRVAVADFPSSVLRVATVGDALAEAEAVVIATPWPEYKELAASALGDMVVVDPFGVLARSMVGREPRTYLRVGAPRK